MSGKPLMGHYEGVESDAPPLWQLFAAVAGAILLLFFFRRSDKKYQRHKLAKVGSVNADNQEPFSLSVSAPEEGGYLAYLRYVVRYPGAEENFRLRCRATACLDGAPVFEVNHGIYHGPLPVGSGDRQVTTEYWVSVRTYGEGYRRESHVLLGEISQATFGQTIELEGQVEALATTTIMDLEIYLVPVAHRL